MKPIERILKELKSEEACIWFTKEDGTLVLIIKAPLNSCKAIVHGCRTEILFGIDQTVDRPIVHSGIRIYDDLENPLLLTGAHRHFDENENLIKILEQEGCAVVLYSELGLPLVYGQVRIDEKKCHEISNLIGSAEHLYSGEFTGRVKQSLDSFDFSIDTTRAFERAYKIDKIIANCQFQNWNHPEAHFVGLADQAKTKITDEAEGGTLEKHIWFSLENVFPFEVYHSPKFKTKSGEKEVIDILAYHDLGIFLIESKSLSIFEGGIEKSMDKKVLTTQKHIKKGIDQLVGANENMKRGTEFFNSKGELIVFNRNIVPHCIVLVAELLHFGDWKGIENLIMKTMIEKGIYLHVFDLRELVSLLKISQGRKEHFDYHLMKRAEKFVEVQSIHIRSYADVNK